MQLTIRKGERIVTMTKPETKKLEAAADVLSGLTELAGDHDENPSNALVALTAVVKRYGAATEAPAAT